MNNLSRAAITPLVLTYNESPNIARTLKSLEWAKRVVVLDSGSIDETEAVAKSFPNVAWFVRSFDSFKNQTEFGISQTGIDTKYVLALDADMSLSVGVLDEIERQFLSRDYAGGIFQFQFCISGHPILGSLYPPQIRLFRPPLIRVLQVGHGHKFEMSGEIFHFKAPLIHDDRKSLERWMSEQLRYSVLEEQRIMSASHLRWRDWVRLSGLMPLFIGLYAYFKAGGPFYGAAAGRYAYERAIFECLLTARLLSARLKHPE